MDVSKLCRGCMKEVASWEVENFDQRVVDMFSFCTSIQIAEEDKLPKQFCYNCTIKIESSFTYIKRAKEVNVILKNYISRILTSVIVEPELSKNITEPKVSSDRNKHDFEENSNPFEDVDTEAYTDEFINENKTLEGSLTPKNDDKLTNKNYDIKGTEITQINNDANKNTNPTETTKDRYTCQICNKLFLKEGWYKKHIRNEHTTNATNVDSTEGENKNVIKLNECEKTIDSLLQCPKCNKTFISRLWFSRHMDKEHLDKKKYFCTHCPKSFVIYNQYRHHKEQHTEERKFACDTCGRRFKKRKQLAAHALAHGTAHPYKCDKCHMKFKIKSILVGHMKVHQAEKPFLCYKCGVAFRTMNNLEEHMRTHTGERPYACGACAFRAAAAGSLRRHQLRHRGERLHLCPHCRKGFYEPGALGRVAPMCEVCGAHRRQEKRGAAT